MRAYATLSERGRIGRLRTLALRASARYDLDVRRCARAARSFNTIFRIDAADDARLALRVGSHLRIHPEDTEAVETSWMSALRRDAVVPVPVVIEAPEGSRFIDVEDPGVPEPRRCVLFEWIGGRSLGERLDRSTARRLGELSAILHDHAAEHAGLVRPDVAVADRVLYWSLRSRLDELAPAYGALFTDALARAQEAIDRLWSRPPHAPHLLHGDLHPANMLTRREQLVVIDFQDLFWGFEQQDLAITISVIRTYDEPAQLLNALRDGYASFRPWPEMSTEELDALLAARWIQQLNLGLHVRKPGLDTFVARRAERLRAWMEGAEPHLG